MNEEIFARTVTFAQRHFCTKGHFCTRVKTIKIKRKMMNGCTKRLLGQRKRCCNYDSNLGGLINKNILLEETTLVIKNYLTPSEIFLILLDM